MVMRDAHCAWCGQPFAADQSWPRVCAGCGHRSYRNPLPVAVILVPVDGGLLLVRRNIPPQVGELALPGGYIGLGETWQAAGAREVWEETGLRLDAAAIRDFGVLTDTAGGYLLVFGLAAPHTLQDLAGFVPNAETAAYVIARAPQELAFPLHTAALHAFFRARAAHDRPA
ncbi:MAG TPA: NUDIX domain-containing protein [Chloroflexia bacterium]|nr:NUDIX domain-containing protein [Chloroflexia bacterium]